MKYPIEKCPICSKDMQKDSATYYYHLMIHRAKEELNVPEQSGNIEIATNKI